MKPIETTYGPRNYREAFRLEALEQPRLGGWNCSVWFLNRTCYHAERISQTAMPSVSRYRTAIQMALEEAKKGCPECGAMRIAQSGEFNHMRRSCKGPVK